VQPGLVASWRREWERRHSGWDFTDLAGVMDEDVTPWDFDALSLEALMAVDDVVDLGTGGGEQLIRLLDAAGDDRPRRVIATEGWPPNIPVARAALAPHGVDVLAHDADADPRMPLADASLDLVLDRHEAYAAEELRRVLRPGGTFLTQQVGSRDASETTRWFGAEARPDWTLEGAASALEAAGLRVLDGGAHLGRYRFVDVRALLRYLSHVPWDLPDGFTVEAGLEALVRLHDETCAGRPLTMTRDRWWLRAVRG
jgi:SAM-dependent methyltransferase